MSPGRSRRSKQVNCAASAPIATTTCQHGKTQASQGPLSSSKPTLTIAHQSTSTQETSLRQQALTFARLGRYEQAIEIFNWLIGCHPERASDYNNRGLVYFQNGQPQLALLDYNRAIQLNDRLATVYNNRANCYAALGNLAEAIADYERAIDLNPANIRARINQGITLRDLGQYSQAVDNLDLALQFNELFSTAESTQSSSHLEGHIYAERGRVHHLAGDWNCAIFDYERSLAKLPQQGTSEVDVSYRLRLQVEDWITELLGPLF